MADKKDYYAILGVERDEGKDEIRRAYRKLARKYHPDVNPGDAEAEERFKEISEAYHVLSDPEKRAAYDRGPERFAQEFDLSDFFEQFEQGFGEGGSGGFRFGFGLGDILGVSGGFRSSGGFGGRAGAGAPPRAAPVQGRDVEVPIELSFEEAVRGAEKRITYRRPDRCGSCGGSGRRDATRCETCGGSGRVIMTETTRVKIPAGVDDGARVRIGGKGESGSGGGPAGNLFLRISVVPHALFERRGADLRVDVPVTIYEAALGGTIEVPSLDGTTRINLPAGTRNGQVIRLAGKGAPRPEKKGGGTGDLYVTIRIELPGELDEEGKELLRRFQEEHPYNPR